MVNSLYGVTYPIQRQENALFLNPHFLFSKTVMIGCSVLLVGIARIGPEINMHNNATLLVLLCVIGKHKLFYIGQTSILKVGLAVLLV